MKRNLFLIILLCIYSCWLHAADLKQAQQLLNHKDWSFVENKGQLADENGTKLPDIKYYGHQGGMNIYFRAAKLSFVFTQIKKTGGMVSEANGTPALPGINDNDEPENIKITANRADLMLVRANPNTEIIASAQKEYYENYYVNNINGTTQVHTYSTITYKNIYPHIDMIIYAKEQGMKYEFVVYPGGKVADIQLQWAGVNNLKMLENGGISYAMNLGKMEESKPVSYTKNGASVKSAFVQKNNKISFDMGAYDKSQALVIDPTIAWATYQGASVTDEAFGVAADASGNAFMAGITTSATGMATSGAFLTSMAGTENAFLSKFSSSGSLSWSTYYGSSTSSASLPYTYGYGVAVDGSGNPYISGYTGATGGMATSGAFQTSHGGGSYDGFIAKFTSSGSLSWSTYYGGSGADYITSLTTDASGNVYGTGRSASATGMASSAAYQSSLSGATSYDAVIIKLTSAGARTWSTYYGGGVLDYATQVSVDGSGNVYIAGFTSSTTGIATSGAYQTSHGGGTYDLFLAKFSVAGGITWATYFGGAGIEESGNVAVDKSGNVYLAGFTGSSSGIATAGAYQTSWGGGTYDVCLAKFSSGGALSWATYYGGAGLEETTLYGKCITTDASGNIYISGETSSTTGIATAGAYQTSNGGGTDAFLAEFSSSGALISGTFYGGTSTDVGYAIALDGTGNVFIAGYTTSTNGIATSGAYQTSFASGADCFLAKFGATIFKNNDAGITSILSPTSSFCSGTQAVKVNLRSYGKLELDSVYIGWSINKKAQTPVYWTGKLLKDSVTAVNLGSYNFSAIKDSIKVWTYKPNGVLDSVPTNDTLSVIDTVNVPSATISGGILICQGLDYWETVNIANVHVGQGWLLNYRKQGSTADSIMTGSGSGSFNLHTSILNATTGYTLTKIQETSGSQCSNNSLTSTDTIRINPAPIASFVGGDTICNGDNGFLKVSITGVPNGEYWEATYRKQGSVADSAIFGQGPGMFNLRTAPLNTPTSFALTTLSVTTGTAQCFNFKLTAKDTIKINPVPMASISGGTSICAGDKATLLLTVSNVPTGQNWKVTYRKQGSPADSSMSGTGSGIFKLNTNGLSATTGFTLTGISETSGSPQCYNGSLFSSDTIRVAPMPTAIIGGGKTICSGLDASLKLVVSYVQAGQSWKVAYRKQGSASDSFVTGTGSGEFALRSSRLSGTTSYTLSGIWETSGAMQCSNTKLASADTVKVTPYPAANTGTAKAICLGASAPIGSGPVTGNTYTWTSLPSGFSSATANPSVKPSTTTVYVLTESNPMGGCSKTDSVKITVNPLPIANAGSGQTICEGKVITLGAGTVSGNSYYWISKPAGFTSLAANPNISPSKTATYYLTESINATGCSKMDSVKINVNPAPAANIGANQAICAGNSASIGAAYVNGDTYSWASKPSGFASTASNGTVSPKVSTMYYLTETITATGCSKTDSAMIAVNALPVVHWKLNYSGNATVFHALDSSMADTSYHWAFGDGNTGTGHRPGHIYAKNKAYQVSLKINNANGCSNELDSAVNITISGIEAPVTGITGVTVYPNPFQTATTLDYNLSNAGKVTIGLFNIDGRQIATLVNQEQMAGHYQFSINASQYGLTSGSYILKMMLDDKYTSKLIMKL